MGGRKRMESGGVTLSAPLTLAGISLRRRRAGDAAFLAALFAAVRGPMLAATGWPEARRQAFLDQQFALQTRHYDRSYPDLWPGIIERGGVAVGRLYLSRQTGTLHVVDLALLPALRGQGLGGELLRCVLAEAAREQRGVSLHVDQANPAQRLYRRLGFRPTGPSAGPDLLMRWDPSAPAAATGEAGHV